MKCFECNYCKGSLTPRATRMQFRCTHPNQKYINDYFKEHRISKMPAFIGFGEKYSNEPSIKTSPAWCPMKKL